VVAGSSDPTDFDVVINATPIGMKAGDPHPIDSTKFTPAMWVGCVITAPVVTPMIDTARALGCNTLTGAEMFAQVKDLMVEFLMGA
jgi:shikimate dehydrogenase